MRYGSTVDEVGSTTRTKTGSWRTFKAVIHPEKCIECGNCWIFCPEGCVFKKDSKFDVDLDYCKGCGICANECPTQAIDMILEEK